MKDSLKVAHAIMLDPDGREQAESAVHGWTQPGLLGLNGHDTGLQQSGDSMRNRVTPLLSESQIQARVKELGAQLTRDYAGKDLVVVGLLNGVFPFMADLVRAMDLDFDVSFMQVASYGGGLESTGEVHILKDTDRSIRGRHALVVEDIVDTGLTLFKVSNLLKDREPLSLRICTLLDKPSRRKVEAKVDYVGFTIEDHFVVGYGLDLDGKLRNLPYVGVYHP
jgi:hypoxanthine phosphoribosyltransferase